MAVFANAQSAINAVVAAQEAARRAALAAASTVPNGLTLGGLELTDIGQNASGRGDAQAPVQSGPANAPTVTITQVNPRAILTWKSFNVGRDTTLNFDQTTFGGTRAREFTVLNRIEDFNPSQILGRINAPGQVFVVNRNGIIFGGASQINVGTLVASVLDVGSWQQTLPQRNQAFLDGLRPGTADSGAAFGPALAPNLSMTDLDIRALPANLRAARAAGDTERFSVTVRPGARINIADQGFALLAAPRQAINRGTIETPGGQTHLVAGTGIRFVPTPPGAQWTFQAPSIGYAVEAFRRPANFTSTSASLNGELDAIRGIAVNDGLIAAPRGSVTLAGSSVGNNGAIVVTTANNRPGSVFLLARDSGGTIENGSGSSQGTFNPFNFAGIFRFGEVRLGAGSVIDVGTEAGPDQVVLDTGTAPFQQSRIGFAGSLVFLEPDAIVRAPAARMRIAGDLTAFANTQLEAGQLEQFELGARAVIDLGGIKDIQVPVTRNLIEIESRNNTLPDQPVQRDGFLVSLARQSTPLVVDIRLGTALVNWQPVRDNINRGVAERQASGGTLDIVGSNIVTQPDSRIDVSGGWISWQGGFRPPETQLVGSDGRIYRLSNAPADLTYVARPGLFTRQQPRWGITENYVSPLFAPRQVFEPGYLEGFDAGTLSFTGQTLLAGNVDGRAFVGDRQARLASATTPNDGDPQTSADLPTGGSLRLLALPRLIVSGESFAPAPPTRNVGVPVNPTFVTTFAAADGSKLPIFDPRQPGAVTGLVADATGAPVASRNLSLTGSVPAGFFDTQISTANILDNGFANVTIEADGRLLVPRGVAVNLRPGGRLTANVWRAEVNGAIVIPSGSISLTANSGSTVPAVERLLNANNPRRSLALGLPTADAATDAAIDGTIQVGPGAVLSTAGLWINDFAAERDGSPRSGPAFLNGGRIDLVTRYTRYLDTAIRPGRPIDIQTPALPPDALVDPEARAVFGHDIILGRDSLLDVSGGARIIAAGLRPAAVFGSAGALSLRTFDGRAVSPTGGGEAFGSSNFIDQNSPAGFYVAQGDAARRPRFAGLIDQGAIFRGFGLARPGSGAANGLGGTFDLQVPSIVLGRATTTAEVAGGVLGLDLDRIAGAGFADLRFTGTNGGNAQALAQFGGFAGSALPYEDAPGGRIAIAPGAVLAPVAAALPLAPGFGNVATGDSRPALGAPLRLAQPDRSPTRLTLIAENRLTLGSEPAPASILADPGAVNSRSSPLVRLAAPRPILVAGRIAAPGGRIEIAGTGLTFPYFFTRFNNNDTLEPIAERPLKGLEFRLSDSLRIAAGAVLDVSGFGDTVTDERGVIRGAVRPGGTIALRDQRNYLIVEGADGPLPAARLELSGAAIAVTERRGNEILPTAARTLAVYSNAGTLDLSAETPLGTFLDGAIRALPGGPGAAGGTLTLNQAPGPASNSTALDYSYPTLADPNRIGLVLRADPGTPLLPASGLAAKRDPTQPVDPTLVLEPGVGWSGGTFTGRTVLTPGVLAGSGIDRVNFLGTLGIEGSVDLIVGRMLQLPAAIILRGAPGAPSTAPPPVARLAAPYILLGQGGGDFTPTFRTPLAGSLTIAASGQLDVASVALFGASQVLLDSAGDLRLTALGGLVNLGGLGALGAPVELISQGNLTLRSRQTYGGTLVTGPFNVLGGGSQFGPNIVVRRRDGDPAADPAKPDTVPTVTFLSPGGPIPQAPLSANSELSISADEIVQGGVLRAPQGRIVFNAGSRVTFLPGSLTSVSAEGRTVPYGETRSSVDLLGIELIPSSSQVNSQTAPLAAPPVGAIEITAPRIDLQAGARVDLSGRGELVAYRFVAGTGGSRDVLARGTYASPSAPGTNFQFPLGRDAAGNTISQDVYAILPGAQPYGAPFSPLINDSGQSLGRGEVTATAPAATSGGNIQPYVGDQIEIGGGIPGLPAGRYTLLAGRYAILPGAFQVLVPPPAGGLRLETPLNGAVRDGDGRYVVGGYRTVSGTDLREQQQRLITVRPLESWSRFSQIELDTLSGYFTRRADALGTVTPRLPVDAGRLTVTAQRQLVLDASFQFDRGMGGRGGQVEISADRIAISPRSRIGTDATGTTFVTDASGAARADLPGFLPVAGEALTALGAEQITVGGRRGRVRVTEPDGTSSDQEALIVTARAVRVTEGAAVTVPELLLLAAPPSGAVPPTAGSVPDGIGVERGARLVAAGSPILGAFQKVFVGQDPAALAAINRASAALLRVSTAPQIDVTRIGADAATAPLLELAAGALVGGPSATFDVAGAGRIDGDATFLVGDLQIGGERIVLGAPPAPIPRALTLEPGVLGRLGGVETLTLLNRGAQPIDVFGAVSVAATRQLILETPGLRAADAGSLTLAAPDVTLRNRIGNPPQAATSGPGAFTIVAPGTTRFGEGAFTLAGFGPASILTGVLEGNGTGSLEFGAPLSVVAGRITARAGADATLRAPGALTLLGAGDTDPDPAIGGRLDITAASITLDTRIVLRGGTLALTASAGDIVLGAGSAIDLRGLPIAFFDVTRSVGGGSATLSATGGISVGGVIDVSAVDLGDPDAAAGRIGFVAGGAATFAGGGGVRGVAGPLARSGSFTFTGSAAIDLASINPALDAGGFFESRVITSGVGDLVVDAAQSMRAREVVLTASGGEVRIDGRIDAGGTKGGRIGLYGRDAVRLGPGSVLTALNQEPGRRGGTIELATTQGPLDLAGVILADTQGASDPLYGGRVVLRVPEAQLGASRIDAARIAARGGAELEPFAVLLATNGVIDPAAIAARFATLEAATQNAIPGLRITPGIEVVNPTGGLALAEGQAIDLATLRTRAGQPGTLTLRAGGDLTVLANISDGFTTPNDDGRLAGGNSWSLRLVGGADTASPNPLAVRPAGGSVLVGKPYLFNQDVAGSDPTTSPVLIRTGTGSIQVAAASDVLLRDPDAVIYTAGRQAPITACPGIANCVLVTGVRADGSVATEYFYLPLDPTYLAFASTAQEFPPLVYAGLAPPASPTAPYAATLAAFPEAGGDLRVSAGRDILATLQDGSRRNASQLPRAWLWRVGAVDDETGQFFFRPGIDGAGRNLFRTATQAGAALGQTPPYSSQSAVFINFAAFKQNFGVLGGGDVEFQAGGDLRASVNSPANYQVGGGLPENYQFSYFETAARPVLRDQVVGVVPGGGTPAVVRASGGGDVRITLGGNLVGGSQLLVGRGSADVLVGGGLTNTTYRSQPIFDSSFTSAVSVGTVIALGDASLRIAATGDINASFYDPLLASAGRNQRIADGWSFGGFQAVGAFTTQTTRTSLALVSAGGITLSAGELEELGPAARAGGSDGRLRLRDALASLRGDFPPQRINAQAEPNLFPGTLPANLSLVAFTGAIGQPINLFQGPAQLTLFGAASGRIEVLAGGDLRLPSFVIPSRLDPFLDTLRRPALFNLLGASSTSGVLLGSRGQPSRSIDFGLPGAGLVVPPPATFAEFGAASRATFYALGDITRPNFTVERRLGLRAGGDIQGLDLDIQHSGEGDLSFVRAGGDIVAYLDPRSDIVLNTALVRGPGRLQIIAGGSLVAIAPSATTNAQGQAQPTSGGLRSVGNAGNLLLPEGGATIDVLVGIGRDRGFDADALLTRLLDPAAAAASYGTYRIALGAVVRQDGDTQFLPGTAQPNGAAFWLIQPNAPAPTDTGTLARIRALPEPERLALAIDLYFRELAAAGREASAVTGPRRGTYVRGFDAVDSLFPFRGSYAGSLNLQTTFVRTEKGGDINLLAPGGDLLIGAVAGAPEPIGFADRFGVLTLGFGNLNLFADGDIAAGQSRLLTLDGGDILAWSSTRDINAGLGAKTARFIPPFRVGYLPNLVQVADRAGQITGSGIATFPPFTPPEQVESLRRAPSPDFGTPASNQLIAPLNRAEFLDAGRDAGFASTEAAAQTEELRKRRQPLTDRQRARLGVNTTGPQLILIAPFGTVDFGDAGVRVAGDLTVAAARVANAENATVAGTSIGVPTTAAPNVAGALAAASTAGAANQAAETAASASRRQGEAQQRPRNLTARVIGWGDSEEEAARPR